MRAERAPCRLRERSVHRQAHVIARVRTQERAQRSHAIHIAGHARERSALHALHPRRAVTLRTVARHGRERRTVGIAPMPRGITLGKDAARTVEDAPAPHVVFGERRPRVERMRGKRRGIPHAQFDEIEELYADESEQEERDDGDVLSNPRLSHPSSPPDFHPRARSRCR